MAAEDNPAGEEKPLEVRVAELENAVRQLTGQVPPTGPQPSICGVAQSICGMPVTPVPVVCAVCRSCAVCSICSVCNACSVCNVCAVCSQCFECSCGPCASGQR